MACVLELKNVSKIVNHKHLVDDISFQLNSGEIFGFLGPNGAGKTTTIKMITGLISISSGEIFIEGKSVKKDFENAIEQVGAIIENPEMYGYLSGLDNLKLFANMHKGITDERIREVTELVKLGNRINDKVKTYSLGMRQRLGVAQALLHKPKLIILDEPTNGLDPMGIKELREMLRELVDKEGIAVMVSSHLLSEMELMCDRFGIIDNGKMIGERKQSDLHGDTLTSSYSIDSNDLSASQAIIKENFPLLKSNLTNEKLMMLCSKNDIAHIVRLLIENNISVFEVSKEDHSLEHAFMEITSGSKTQIR